MIRPGKLYRTNTELCGFPSNDDAVSVVIPKESIVLFIGASYEASCHVLFEDHSLILGGHYEGWFEKVKV